MPEIHKIDTGTKDTYDATIIIESEEFKYSCKAGIITTNSGKLKEHFIKTFKHKVDTSVVKEKAGQEDKGEKK